MLLLLQTQTTHNYSNRLGSTDLMSDVNQVATLPGTASQDLELVAGA